MARDFERMVRGSRGIFIPSWAVGLAGFALLTAAGLFILKEPVLGFQTAESPDHAFVARMHRLRYVKDYFRVQIKDGLFWQTVYTSPNVTGDLSVDLGERLRWNEEARGFELLLEGKPVWSLRLRGD
ncbi:MAG: hypothetical protein U1F77_14425 [Kiritimatiellia bacterium]